LVYSFVGLTSKITSGKPFLSSEFFLYALLVFGILVVYALLWQKALKIFPLVKAYSNKGAVIVWNLLWATLFMRERITLENMIGSAIIIVGIVLVSSDGD
jgi:drug/metabolite transporter (DMT)-like permease